MRLLTLAPLAIALSMLAACTDPDDATRTTLQGMGYTGVRITGSAAATLFYCKHGDSWGRSFTAVGPTGVYAEGTACGGYLMHGTTVRFG